MHEVGFLKSTPEARYKPAKSILQSVCLCLYLSACVGSTVNTTLETAALNSPDGATTLEASAGAVDSPLNSSEAGPVPQAPLTSVPIPVRSPISSELALTANLDQNNAENAAQAVLAEPANAPANDLKVNAGKASDAKTSNQPVMSTNTDGITNIPAPAMQASLTPQPKKKPANFFELLFGAKKAQTKRTIAKQTTTVANKITTANSNTPLPGVKNSSEIFGITDQSGTHPANLGEAVQVASVGAFGRLISKNGLTLQTERVSVDCFKPELVSLLKSVERHYNKRVIVTSGYRSPSRNRRAGGVKNSTHIYCKAADIQIEGVSKWDLAKYLRSIPGRGGVGTYCRTKSVHIDIGTQRDWHHPCRRSSKKRKKRA